MHFALTYDLAATEKRRQEIENKIKLILSPYKFVKKLSTFYIVHIDVQSEWDTILSKFVDLSTQIPEQLHFIMTPVMQSDSRYNGILPRGEWDEINTISSM